MRWERPGFGLVGPDEFIRTAEDTGLIIDIGAWVLDQACREAAGWARRWPDRRLGVSVNVSSRQLATHDIVDLVEATLARTGLDPTRLTLELTESTLIDDTINTQTILHEIRDLGLNLSLDDFGTGYSSLTYLRSFPINVVKIDKSFVRTIGTEREDTAIVVGGARARQESRHQRGGRGSRDGGAARSVAPAPMPLPTGLPVLEAPTGRRGRRPHRERTTRGR